MRVVLAALFAGFLVSCSGSPGAVSSPAPAADRSTTGVADSVDGVSVAYQDLGASQGRQPAIVFIHGWAADRSAWDFQVEAFSARNRVIRVDLGGHGASGGERPGWPLERFGDDVVAVVDRLGLQRVVLVGHSMGGPVALSAAALLGERVIGIVGVDTLLDAEQPIDPERFRVWMARWNADFVGTCRDFVLSLFPDQADPSLVRRVTDDLCDADPSIARRLVQQFPGYDMASALRAVQVPVRCINSDRHPTDLEANRRHHPDFDVVVMTGVGHFPMLERPQEFNVHLAKLIDEIAGP